MLSGYGYRDPVRHSFRNIRIHVDLVCFLWRIFQKVQAPILSSPCYLGRYIDSGLIMQLLKALLLVVAVTTQAVTGLLCEH
jgi:hypothetical protein